jgi:ABC-2 type transport system permease protein
VTVLRGSLPLAATAARIGVSDFRATYTWRTWTFGWLLRLLTQAAFFGSFGLWLGSRAALGYLVVGNAVVLVCIEALVVIPSVVFDRHSGTLPLQVAAPGAYIVSYLARNLYCPVIGTVSSSVAFFGITALFGVHLAWPAAALVPVLIGVTGCTTYAYGFAVAAVVMRFPSLSMVALNVSYLSMMTFCGVNVPVSFWPGPVQGLAGLLPLTYGLRAVRQVLAGSPAGAVAGSVLMAVAAGLGWLVAGTVIFAGSVRAGRRRGTLGMSA